MDPAKVLRKHENEKKRAKVLRKHENEKKRKYLQPCLDQRRHFSPFVVSTDGMLGREASCLIKRLSQKLATKNGKGRHHASRRMCELA
jgi:hypothetical protein